MGGIGKATHVPPQFSEQPFNAAERVSRDLINPVNEAIMLA